MKKNKNKTIKDLLVEYFKANPKQDMSHGPVVDWVEARYLRLYHKKPRDTWRSIRNLHETGFLIKVKKGIYRYDPEAVYRTEKEDFSQKQKEEILKKGEYTCAKCGRKSEDGVELHVDHIKPKYEGGKATLANGQVLCSRCNFIKKHLKQTETGKRMFINLYELAKSENKKEVIDFCSDLLAVFEKHKVNGHIVWKK